MARVKRGDIWLARLDPAEGDEIRKTRPVVVIQNDLGNTHSNTTIVAPVTAQHLEHLHAVDVFLSAGTLPRSSKVLLSQIRTLDKRRLLKHLGHITSNEQHQIDEAIKISLGLIPLD